MNQTGLNSSNLSSRFTIVDKVAVVECTIGVVVNALLLVVIIINPLNNLRKSTWITIANLTVADLLTSATSIPFSMPEEIIGRNHILHYWATACLFTCYSGSFFLLSLLTIERYIAICKPLQSWRILSRKRICLARITCWVLAILTGIATLYRGLNKRIVWISIFCALEVAVVLMIVFTVLIIFNIHEVTRHVVRNEDDNDTKEITVALLIIIFILMVTAFPYFIAKQIEQLAFKYPQLLPGTFNVYFPYYYFPVACLNFVVNPFVYAWRLPSYRNAFVALFTKILSAKNRPRRNPSPQDKAVAASEDIELTRCLQ